MLVLKGEFLFEDGQELVDKMILHSNSYPNVHLLVKYYGRQEPIFHKRNKSYYYGKSTTTWEDWEEKASFDAKDVEWIRFLQVGTKEVCREIFSHFYIKDNFGNRQRITSNNIFLRPITDYNKAILEVESPTDYKIIHFENNRDSLVEINTRKKYKKLEIPKKNFISIKYI